MNLQKIQAKITPISVPIYELPEYICVETKCITKQYALENNIQASLTLSKRLMNKLQDEKKSEIGNGKPGVQPARSGPSKKTTVEYTQVTDTNPSRARSVQTNCNSTSEIGVQCQRDLDDEWDEWEQAFNEKPVDESTENEEEFLKYVGQHTSMFTNGMLECQVCGEIANCLQEHQSHMIMHYGPQALCTDCGKLVGHQSLMSKHSYGCPNRVNAKSRPIINMQCPHLHCSVMVNTHRQLAKHLKIHLGVNSYYCLQCRKSFSSSAQFLVHRTVKSACSKAKHIYLAKNNAKLRKKSNPKRCTICMKQFGSIRRCVQHRRRCILAYHKRLKKLLSL